MNRSRYVVMALIVGFVLWRWIWSGPTPTAEMNAWVQKYELSDTRLLNHDIYAVNNASLSSTVGQTIRLCERGLKDVNSVMTHPLPPNTQMKTLYVKALKARRLAYFDCVSAIELASPSLVNQAIAASNVANSYSRDFNRLGIKMGFSMTK